MSDNCFLTWGYTLLSYLANLFIKSNSFCDLLDSHNVFHFSFLLNIMQSDYLWCQSLVAWVQEGPLCNFSAWSLCMNGGLSNVAQHLQMFIWLKKMGEIIEISRYFTRKLFPFSMSMWLIEYSLTYMKPFKDYTRLHWLIIL